MKKSTWLLIIGICIIVLTFVADAIISGNFVNMSDPSSFSAIHYVYIALSGVLVIAGIALIIAGRKIAKKGN